MARRGAKVLLAALVAVAASPATAWAAPAGSSVMPMTSILRACDYSVAEHTWRTGYARAVAFVHPATADSVALDVQLQTALPDTDYYVKVFQMPRGSADCAVAPVRVRTDGAGAAYVTITTPIDADTTGVWASVERPSAFSQQPAEVYTSDFIAKV
ncbi:hypothetical protein A7U43_02460 [Mycobacterium adipatum]|uniref:Uncharacterized protein n=1 Tax=Mycobacterium adipatum TaxID=1682113 RepID=A0A172UHD4_9MYCO|nr:hypothetical protein [Mycobacterium adipatum]ANE78351.1 hypothetical protein A7U43_02460 [Mycobacterium adipatum]